MIIIVRAKLVFVFTLLVIGQWRVECGNRQAIDWSLYQRVQTLPIGIIQNKNLNKYMNLSASSTNDNKAFINDRTKVKRSYNTERCIKDLRTIQEASSDEKPNWANKMLGAWGKVSSAGIDKDFGNFDRCFDLKVNKSMKIETQYCLAGINTGMSNLKKIVPILSEVGICIPSSCAPSLIAAILNDYLDSNKTVDISIGPTDCRLKNDNTTLFLSYKIFIAFLTTVLGLVILSSIYDITYTVREEPKNPVLLAFSAYTNGKNLFACKANQSPNVMPCLDGIRAIAALCIVSIHFEVLINPIIGNTEHDAPVADKIGEIFINGRFSVDTFFVLSAFLAANKMLNEHSKNGRLNIPLLYLQRVLRLSPVTIVIALFSRFLLQFCANGPEYNHYLDFKRQDCEIAMWDSLLYIDNIRLKQCVPGAWYLAADMQLYLLTPFLVLLLQRYPKRFMGFSFAIVSIDLILSLNKEFFGLGGYDKYFTTRSRITPWLIGVNFAYVLLQMRSTKPIRIPKLLNSLLLTGSVCALLWFTHTYRNVDFLWETRAWWSLSLCYIIFSCVTGQGGVINWFLSHPRWQPISRLSFSIYLIHVLVIIIIYANQKVPWCFSTITQVQELFLVVSSACAVAVVLALTVEMPIINLSHIFLNKNNDVKKCTEIVSDAVAICQADDISLQDKL
ncbi:nose resistant to fluoxetine protein 6-like [Sitodiplosis mosellana]|uniref:nose resistant to fluoxetine protein 6-like n=1 Tax=Sitodiplosis mosellana TaxID=263140 RepID=UPI00244521BF|nr:nose resistant to fluoxetine protein 6-like [Sitodiplosis mosellana]